MCGLFGIAGSGILIPDIYAFRDLMMFSIVRGKDGTGVAFGNSSTGRHQVLKHHSDAMHFDWTLTEKQDDALYSVNNDYMIGHTRWATTGKRNFECTQPFIIGRIVGVHNGTLSSPFDGYSTDSEMLLASIEKYGLKAVLNNLNEGDSMALSWYDKAKKKIHFFRNEARELCFALNEKRTVLYWASEMLLLRAALARRNIEAKFWHFTENYEFTFDPRTLTKGDKPYLTAVQHEPTYAPKKKEQKESKNDNLPWNNGVDV